MPLSKKQIAAREEVAKRRIERQKAIAEENRKIELERVNRAAKR